MFKNPLENNDYRLEALTAHHLDGLKDAASCDAQIWKFSFTDQRPFEDEIVSYLNDMCKWHADKTRFAYVIIRKSDNKIIGSSRYYDISESDKRVSIGFTWLIPEVWGSGANPSIKYLMLSQVFESWKWNRVTFDVDSRNGRSISAMLKLGASKEGILKKHKIVQRNYVRDTVIFGITNEDWDTIKTKSQTVQL